MPIRPIFLVLLIVVAGCSEELPKPTRQEDPAPFPGIADAIRELPYVAEVIRSGPDEEAPTHRVIHIADWHFVDRENFAADLRNQTGEHLTEEQIDAEYGVFIDQVALLQRQQRGVLKLLVEQTDLKAVHIEGVTPENRADYEKMVLDHINSAAPLAPKFYSGLGPPPPSDRSWFYESLYFGEASLMFAHGDLDAIVPLEDAQAYVAANPITADGQVVFDPEKIEAQEDGQARTLLASGPFSVVVLGGGHDLSDNLERLSGGKAEYLRVELKAWREAATEAPDD